VGNSQFNLILSHIIDAVAEKLGMDPVDFCVKNFAHEWEKLPSASLVAVLREGAARLGWKEKRHAPGKGPLIEGVKKRGVGFSFHAAWHSEWQEKRRGKVQVNLVLNPDCTILLNAATIEVGGGSNTCNVLGCAEALRFLGIEIEDIHWTPIVDTNDGIKDCVQTDSAVAYLQSEVMIDSAKELKEKLKAAAAEILGKKPAEIDIVDGKVILASDPSYDPHTDGGCDRCLGTVTLDGNSVKRNPAYYILAHAARHVRPGSVRVSTNMLGGLPNVGFMTPDAVSYKHLRAHETRGKLV